MIMQIFSFSLEKEDPWVDNLPKTDLLREIAFIALVLASKYKQNSKATKKRNTSA